MIGRVLVCFIINLLVTCSTDGFLQRGTSSPHCRPMTSWSQHAEFDQQGSILIAPCEQLDGYNLISPREWLEYYEEKGGGSGAYTVVRCDMSNTGSWKIWEKEFHLKRLVDSFRAVHDNCGMGIHHATRATETLIETLLSSGRQALMAKGSTFCQDSYSCPCMVTLLWQVNQELVSVRVHFFTSAVFSSPLDYNPEPITASLAIVTTPNRYENNPQAKLAQWCSLRRPLEEQFKHVGIGEVLLTRQVDHETLEILEGLTSNVFVVFRNGTLRTPNEGVLNGCARSQVLRHARLMGYLVECGPIMLGSVENWEEVFCTSSIRMLVPVNKVVDGRDGTMIWHASTEPHSWRAFYHSIINE